MAHKYVYLFREGRADMKNLLGGKGANLAEMTALGLPVPQGFTVSTEACTAYYNNNKQIPAEILEQIDAALAQTEEICGKKFGDMENPASRILSFDNRDYTIGCLLMSNFGAAGNLKIEGKSIATRRIDDELKDRGSVVIVLGTDLPLNERQLKRTAKRAVAGLVRVGSYLGNGSGDIAIAFSNGNLVPHYSQTKILPMKMLHDDTLDRVFEATAEVVEEAVISSLYHAKTVKGIRGKVVRSLKEFL